MAVEACEILISFNCETLAFSEVLLNTIPAVETLHERFLSLSVRRGTVTRCYFSLMYVRISSVAPLMALKTIVSYICITVRELHLTRNRNQTQQRASPSPGCLAALVCYYWWQKNSPYASRRP